jgi:hypothetical protein
MRTQLHTVASFNIVYVCIKLNMRFRTSRTGMDDSGCRDKTVEECEIPASVTLSHLDNLWCPHHSDIMQSMYERFSDNSRRAMELANQASSRLHHGYIGTEHLLLGLIGVDAGLAADVLKNLGIDSRKIGFELERLIQAGPEMANIGKLLHTPRARHVAELAVQETQSQQRPNVDTADLLVGLFRESNGVAAQVLMNQGLQLKPLLEEIERARATQTEAETHQQGILGKLMSLWTTKRF